MLLPALVLGLASIDPTPSSSFAQEVSYVIEARLDARENLLFGDSRVRYTNHSPGPIGELYLHLHPNTWRDRYSTAAKEQSFYHDQTIRRVRAEDRGYLDVERLLVDGTPVRFQVIDTLLKFKLEKPLASGATLEMAIEWTSRIRKLAGGAGREGAHYELANWYPRVAVYDQNGWQAEPVHDAGGSYSDFARYDVSLTVPTDYVVVATGELTSGDAGWVQARERALSPVEPKLPRALGDPFDVSSDPPKKTVRFVAERANDFAWLADPTLCLEEELHAGTRLRVLYTAHSAPRWKAVAMTRLRLVADWLTRLTGPYPWSHLSIGETLGSEPFVAPMLALARDPAESHLIEAAAAMRFSNVIGSDGIGEAWLAQGFQVFAARRYLTDRFGPAAIDPDELDPYQRLLRQISARERAQLRVLTAARFGRDEPVATPIHLFRDRAARRPAIRDKASLFVDALAAALGADGFAQGLRDWTGSTQLANTSEAELLASFERSSGRDLGPLFRAWLHSTRITDLKVTRIKSREQAGLVDVEVEIRRGGELATPVDLLFRAVDGSEQRVAVPTEQGTATIHAVLSASLARVELDPEAISLERNRLDNRNPRSAELVFGWPFQSYTPRDSFVISWRPSLWYNAVDHVRTGLVFESRPGGQANRFKLATSLGMEEKRFGFDLSFRRPISSDQRTELDLRALLEEGRRLYVARLRTNLSPRIERAPRANVEAGYSSFSVRETEYLRPGRVSDGRVSQVFMELRGETEGNYWKSDSKVRFQAAGKTIDSDYSFIKLSAEAGIAFDRAPSTLKLRAFVGSSNDEAALPLQERFFLSGADPMSEYLEAGLRSVDSSLTYLHYHLAGGGNFRAYNDTAVSGRRLVAVNFEADRALGGTRDWAPGGLRIGRPSLAVFADLAKIEGTGVDEISRNALFGLGVGARVERRIYGRKMLFRLDFPFYVNRPGADESGEIQSRVSPRWLVSLGSAY